MQEYKLETERNRELLHTERGLHMRDNIGIHRGEHLYKGRALTFIEQGVGRLAMWDKSHDTWDSLC